MIENRYDIETMLKLVDDNFCSVGTSIDDLHGDFDDDINYACHNQENF